MAEVWNIEEARLLLHLRDLMAERHSEQAYEVRSVFAEPGFKSVAMPLVRSIIEKQKAEADWSYLQRRIQSEAWGRVKARLAGEEG